MKNAKTAPPCARDRKQANRPATYKGAMKVSKEQLIQAVDKSSGIVSHVAAILQIDTRTVKRYLSMIPEAQAAFEDAKGITIDLAESELLNIMQNREHPRQFDALVFVLKTIGKERGYTERVEQEVTGKDGAPLAPPSIIIQPVKVSGDASGEKTKKE